MLIHQIPLRKLISGLTHHLRVMRIPGTDPHAPGAYIQAGLHAAELQGTAVIFQLAAYLKDHPPLGNVTLVPQANPFAADVKMGEYTYGRFNPTTGDNWNRLFQNPLIEIDAKKFKTAHKKNIETAFQKKLIAWGHEQLQKNHGYGTHLALTLQTLAYEAMTVLDLHCDSVSQSHVYVPSYAMVGALYLNIPTHFLTPKEFTPCMNQACFYPWWVMMDLLGRPIPFQSFTVELGDKEVFSFEKARHQAEGILNYLRHRGTISGDAAPFPSTQVPVEDFVRIYAPLGGLVDYHVPIGTFVKKGDPLVTILDMESFQPVVVRAPMDSVLITHTSSGAVHQGSELVKLMKRL